jgi:Piwi domain
MFIETNCFRIKGLDALLTEYRLFQITGLRRESPEYYGNIQRMVKQLSYQMRAPVTTYDENGETFLVLPKGFGNPPDHIKLVGTLASLKDTGRVINLEFDKRLPELDPVRLRFLQFAFQNPLWNDSRLWQPGAGKPFFFRKPEKQLGGLDLFEGFAMRVSPHPEGGFGVIVDLRRKLVSRSPLAANISRDQVNRLKGRSCVYRMGHSWYEVSISGLADRRVGEPSIVLNGKPVSLVDYLHTTSPKPVPPSIANLKPDGAAIYYRTNGPDQKAAPAELCYLVEDTHGREGARHQPETIIEPYDRHRQINRIVKLFFGSIKIGNTVLSVSEQAGRVTDKPFTVPALRFGNNAILQIDPNSSRITATNEYGRQRLALLSDSNAGFYVRSLLDRQYLVLPRSIANSSGERFLIDLKAQVDTLFPDGGSYDPEVIEYDDLNGARDFVGQSRAIKAAIEAANVKPGCALVMVHRYDRRARSADQLAAWTVKELAARFELTASVIHTDMVKNAYGSLTRDGETQYVARESERRRLQGYLRNVALNKILLTNGKWPFVLETPLHADVVLGIDVKNNTAAFTLIADGGKVIRFDTSPSRQKEQLLRNQVSKYVYDMLRKEAGHIKRPAQQITVHRDGRVWTSEIDGLRDACERLAAEGVLDSDWKLTVVEISKSAPAPLRLFFVKPPSNGRGLLVDNPIVGTWTRATDDEGYVCTTGKPFRIPGTANPLHVRRAFGSMPIEQCISDVFALSCLTWPRPEGAMRLPISIKLCDRSLFEEAAQYDEDAVQFSGNDVAGGTK